MWSVRYWLGDRVVGGVTNGCLGKDFDEFIESGTVRVPSA